MSEWEYCKENIKPKREGRSISSINTTPKGTPLIAQIQERQAQFEREIKEYSGDDELQIWMKYVHYMENAYPEGDYLSNVGTIQFRLIDRFQKVEQYKQDIRLLGVFLSLANHSPDPAEIYAYCFYHNIVTNFSKFWYNWINCWIYQLRYDKALRICEKAIKIFKNTSMFRGMKVQILRLIDSSSNENMGSEEENLRKAGVLLTQDNSQTQRSGPSLQNKPNAGSFRIFKDRNEIAPSIPSMSTNPLETKDRTKENATQSKQRWKNVVAETDTVSSSGKVFAVFEEDATTDTGVQKYEKSTTALKAKKVTASANPGQSVKLLNPTSTVMTTVAYQKSKVYPLTGDVWSFEEIEARRRFSLKKDISLLSVSQESTGSKRSSLESEPTADEIYSEPKRRSIESAIPGERTLSQPLKSCLSTSKFGHNITSDFNIENTIMSSTKKINIEKDNEVEEPAMAPNFNDASKMKDRLSASLNLSVRSEQSLFKSDFKKTVNDSLNLAGLTPHAEPDEVADASFEIESNCSDLVDAAAGDFTFKGLQTSLGIQNYNSQFAIYEDTALRGSIKKSEEPEIEKNAFSKKKLKLHTPLKVPQQDENISKDSDGFNDPNLSFGVGFDIDDINGGRPSDAFNIFQDKKSTDRSVEDSHVSYSLKTVALSMTPCNNSSSSSYVPCTVERMGKRSNDTQVINKQVLNMLNDCSRISEGDELTNYDKDFGDFKCPVQLSKKSCLKSSGNKGIPFERADILSDRPENAHVGFEIFSDDILDGQNITDTPSKSKPDAHVGFEIFSDDILDDQNIPDTPSKSTPDAHVGFEIFSDAEAHISLSNTTDQLTDFKDKNQLTPILEGSRESNCSSVDYDKMSKATNASRDKSVIAQFSVIDEETESFADTVNLTGANRSNLGANRSNLGASSKDQSLTSLTNLSNFNRSETRFIDIYDQNNEMTRRSIEATVEIPDRGSSIPDQKQVEFELPTTPIHETLFPDKTNRDIQVDVGFLKRVPRTSLAPTEPVTDPYDQDLIECIIQSLDPPLFFKPHYNQFEDEELIPKREVTLGRMTVKNITKIGEGAFAKVYSGDCLMDGGTVSPKAFKIQSPPAPWEFYILTELRERMSKDEIAHEVRDMILPMSSIHVYRNLSVLTTCLYGEGSLLDMMNHYRNTQRVVSQTVICTYTLDMLRCVDAIHRTQIIHGDIKPDNWLLRDKENTMQSMSMKLTKSVVLIDFGRSIDMAILPPGSLFTVPSKTDLFECVEMQTNRPWTFQIDYYGMLSCIHLMIHSEYMKVYLDKSVGYWKPTRAPHRRVDKDLFSRLFQELLNIPDCHSIPTLTKYIAEFETYLKRITPKNRHTELKTHYQFMSQRQL